MRRLYAGFLVIALCLMGLAALAADGDTNFTNVVTSGDVTVGDALAVTGASTLSGATTITTSTSSATPSASQRSLIGTINVGTTTAITAVTNNPSFVALRGIANVGSISGTGQPYIHGVQGKLAVASGKTINNASTWASGMFAQLDLSAGTYTAGQIAGIWIDAGASANASAIAFKANVNLIRVTNTVSTFTVNSILSATANATYFADLACADGTAGWYDSTAHGSTAAGRLKLKVGGADVYIHLFSD